MSIQQNCVIMNVKIGSWKAQRLDKNATAKVIKDAKAKNGTASVNKHLLDKEDLKEIVACDGKIRNHLYAKTLPWSDTGARLITKAASLIFIEEHMELQRERQEAVAHFVDEIYPAAVDRADFRMAGLFNPSDFPTPGEIKRRFYVHLDIVGVSPTKDIRLENSADLFQLKVTRAIQGLWVKLAKPLEHFAVTMSDEEATFRDSAIENLRAVCDMIPALNFVDDPALEAIRADIEKTLLPFDAKDLRKDPKARAAVGRHAAKVTSKVKEMMAAFADAEDEEE